MSKCVAFELCLLYDRPFTKVNGLSASPRDFQASPDRHMTEAGNPQKGGKQHRWGAPYREQIRILFTRTIKTRRFEALSIRDFLQFLIVGVLAGKAAAPLALPWHCLQNALPCPLSRTAMPFDVRCHALFHALLCPLLCIATPIGHASAHQKARQ